MNTLALFGLCLAVCVAGALATYRWVIRPLVHRNPPLPQRTPEDVLADVDAHRRKRETATCFDIWPDAPSWRTAETQHRIDTAKQRKEEDR